MVLHRSLRYLLWKTCLNFFNRLDMRREFCIHNSKFLLYIDFFLSLVFFFNVTQNTLFEMKIKSIQVVIFLLTDRNVKTICTFSVNHLSQEKI